LSPLFVSTRRRFEAGPQDDSFAQFEREVTGERIQRSAGDAGALVRRGEAVAEVTATGARTKFGRTAELVRTAHVVSSQQKAVLRVVRNLAAFSGVVILMLVAYAYFLKMPPAEIIPLVLTQINTISTTIVASGNAAAPVYYYFYVGKGSNFTMNITQDITNDISHATINYVEGQIYAQNIPVSSEGNSPCIVNWKTALHSKEARCVMSGAIASSLKSFASF
jgi:E1-E2 ATPase